MYSKVYVSIQAQNFDLTTEVENLKRQDTVTNGQTGAICSFIGCVREMTLDTQCARPTADAVHAIELECYQPMAEKVLNELANEACARFGVQCIRIIHRIGKLNAKDNIVLVVTSSSHRQAAFQACQYVMDFLKTQAPIWKKEYTAHSSHWVAAKISDEEQSQRW